MRKHDEVGGDDSGGGESPEGVDEHASAESGGGVASSTARGIEGETRGDAGADASGDLRAALGSRAEEEGEESEAVLLRVSDMLRMVSIAFSRGLPGGRFLRAFCNEYGDDVRFVAAVESTA